MYIVDMYMYIHILYRCIPLYIFCAVHTCYTGIGSGRWRSVAIGDFQEHDARDFFNEQLQINAAADTHVADEDWAAIYDVSNAVHNVVLITSHINHAIEAYCKSCN
jgi:hypothetical protein